MRLACADILAFPARASTVAAGALVTLAGALGLTLSAFGRCLMSASRAPRSSRGPPDGEGLLCDGFAAAEIRGPDLLVRPELLRRAGEHQLPGFQHIAAIRD